MKSTGLKPYKPGMENLGNIAKPLPSQTQASTVRDGHSSSLHCSQPPLAVIFFSFLIFVCLLVCFVNLCLSKGLVTQTKLAWDFWSFCLSLSRYIMGMFCHAWPCWLSPGMKAQPCSIYWGGLLWKAAQFPLPYCLIRCIVNPQILVKFFPPPFPRKIGFTSVFPLQSRKDADV